LTVKIKASVRIPLPEDLLFKVIDHAKKDGCTLQQYCQAALRMYIRMEDA